MKAVLSEDNLRDIVAGALRRHLLKEEDTGSKVTPPTIEEKIDSLAEELYREGEINVFPSAKSPDVKFEFAALPGGTFVLESPSVYTATEGVPAQNFLGVFKAAEGGKYKTGEAVNTAMAAALVKYISGSELVAQMSSVTDDTSSPVLINARKETKKPGSPDAIRLEITGGKIYGAKAVYDKTTVALMVLDARQKGRKAGKDLGVSFSEEGEQIITGILGPVGEKK